MQASFLKKLSTVLAKQQIFTDSADCLVYSYDNGRHRGLAKAVVFPETTKQVSQVVQLCHAYHIPIVPRGRGTGTPGGAVPVQGGIVLSLERMDKLITLDQHNRFIYVESGILNKTVQDSVRPLGFFWAPNPGSSAFCTIGGNIGYNAAGPSAVKYGATREHVLGLTAVTGEGDIIRTGGYTSKSATGYDLSRLLIGSEGTLAIITEAILKLTALPASVIHTFRILYTDTSDLVNAVIALMSGPVLPEAVEFLDPTCVRLLMPEIQNRFMLLVDTVLDPVSVFALLSKNNLNFARTDLSIAETQCDRASLWSVRQQLSQKLRQLAPKKISEDIVIPVTALPELLKQLTFIGQQFDIPIVNFGHIGNGNIHVNLLLKDKDNADNIHLCLKKLFELVIRLNGTLSGEHGIGLEKKAFMPTVFNTETLTIMKKIKAVFDPHHILNPSKIF